MQSVLRVMRMVHVMDWLHAGAGNHTTWALLITMYGRESDELQGRDQGPSGQDRVLKGEMGSAGRGGWRGSEGRGSLMHKVAQSM